MDQISLMVFYPQRAELFLKPSLPSLENSLLPSSKGKQSSLQHLGLAFQEVFKTTFFSSVQGYFIVLMRHDESHRFSHWKSRRQWSQSPRAQKSFNSPQSQSHFLTQGVLCHLLRRTQNWQFLETDGLGNLFFPEGHMLYWYRDDRLTRESLASVSQAHKSCSPASQARTMSTDKESHLLLSPVLPQRVMSCSL